MDEVAYNGGIHGTIDRKLKTYYAIMLVFVTAKFVKFFLIN